jgi:putative two-component system response regulator
MDIIIVDDELVSVTMLTRLVEKLPNCHGRGFTEAVTALAWCNQNDPDLVIVDYMMPELNGIDFARRLRALQHLTDTPLLMVTANADREVRNAALQNGINDFLQKPFDFVELQARVSNMLALRASQKKLANRALLLAEEVREATREIRLREIETLTCLGRASEQRDPETHEHIMRMSNYSRLIAQRLGFTEAECDLMLLAAPMHDIGKVGTPDGILLKPGRLTQDEWKVMKRHTVIGHDILASSSSPILRAAAQIALAHHEKFDGSGYPQGLAGTAIPIYGRIVAVADVFDALTSERPYKPAWDIERAGDYIRQGAGAHFDPACVEAFFDEWQAVLKIRARYQEALEAPVS